MIESNITNWSDFAFFLFYVIIFIEKMKGESIVIKYKVETKVIKNFNDTKDNNKLYEVGEPIVLDRARYEELFAKGFVEKGNIIEERPKVSFKKEEE